MTRWTLPVGVGLVLAIVAVVVASAMVGGGPRTPAERAEALAAELRCPDCQGLSVADSPTRSAQEIRRQIDALIVDGASDDAVRAHFTARYGEWIRLAPSGAAPWLLPFVVVAAGLVGLAVWIGRRRAPVTLAECAGVSEDERRRLHDEAEALDA